MMAKCWVWPSTRKCSVNEEESRLSVLSFSVCFEVRVRSSVTPSYNGFVQWCICNSLFSCLWLRWNIMSVSFPDSVESGLP